MKNFKTLCVAACVAMVGLSSCLGDGKTVTKGTDVPTVVRNVTFEDFYQESYAKFYRFLIRLIQ